jgi:hypothetical protein
MGAGVASNTHRINNCELGRLAWRLIGLMGYWFICIRYTFRRGLSITSFLCVACWQSAAQAVSAGNKKTSRPPCWEPACHRHESDATLKPRFSSPINPLHQERPEKQIRSPRAPRLRVTDAPERSRGAAEDTEKYGRVPSTSFVHSCATPRPMRRRASSRRAHSRENR